MRMEVLPPENVPLDYSALSLGELYYELGQKEKAEMVYKGIADNALRSINWYFRLRPGQLSSVESDLGHNLAVLQEVLRVSKTIRSSLSLIKRNLIITVWRTDQWQKTNKVCL